MNTHFKWKLLMLPFSVAIAALMLSSCMTDDTPSVTSEHSTVLSRSSSVSNVIDAATAEYVAEKFSTIPVDGVERTAKSVSNTVTINNADGIPVMYAVNFAENGGYVIVSASKATSPVIAYSNVGSYRYDNVKSQFVLRRFESLARQITLSFDYPMDSVLAHIPDWGYYLPAERNSAPKRVSASSGYQAIIDKVVSQWYQEGFGVYSISEWGPSCHDDYRFLPDLDRWLATLTMPVEWAGGIPMNQLCYIVVIRRETITTSLDKCAPVITKWSEGAPFNAAVPGGMMLSPEAVALGQILHYYKDPAIIVHSRAENNPLQDNAEISSFLYDVANGVNTVFGTNYSYSTINNMTDALSNRYKYNYAVSQPSEDALVSSINQGSPVMVVGYEATGKSDAWICSRYERREVRRTYMLMAPLGHPEDIIYGPYESMAEWNDDGVSNFYFDTSKDDLYFCAFGDFENWDNLYTNGLVFFGKIFKKNTSS
ncbi:MAG: Spi family protease inhibitor [Paramuribaculum sp.]|nr:Spi family protease inhibitor [Paramuribaculum sp.]MDE7151229.1 Spi family protease inhibitor [Candidatus Amulumruptor sp.]